MIQLRPQVATVTNRAGIAVKRDMGTDEIFVLETGIDRAGNEVTPNRRVGFVTRAKGARIQLIVNDLSEAQVADIKRKVAERDAAIAKAEGDPNASILDWYPKEPSTVDGVRPNTKAEDDLIKKDGKDQAEDDEPADEPKQSDVVLPPPPATN